jgi:thiaminase
MRPSLVLGLAEGTIPDGALQAWVQQDRIGETFRAVVGDLGRGLDELARAPSPTLAQRLGVLFARVARFELTFSDMCWSGQACPG